jgi:hypothetical protein
VRPPAFQSRERFKRPTCAERRWGVFHFDHEVSNRQFGRPGMTLG